MLWDVVAGQLAGQSADQAALSGRAKDLLGVATISTTITGVIVNDKLFNLAKVELPAWWVVLAAVSLIVVFGAGLLAIQPRKYSFAPDAEGFHSIEQKYPDASETELYRAMAEGYLEEAEGKTQLERNRENLKLIELLVRIETGGVVALAVMAFILAFLIS
jgi:hypothetical protein